MAGASLLTLLDDISSLLDDVALMTKNAAVKTSGVVGDDLAVNAEQVAGVAADRELPVVWAVAKGSLGNKAILIPLALLLSAFTPALITPLLMVGGTYLCFEGAEKVWHWLRPSADDAPQDAEQGEKEGAEVSQAVVAQGVAQGIAGPGQADTLVLEKRKIRGAIRTDFVLSTEIIIVALGTIPAQTPLGERAMILCIIGVLLTFGVYGVVGAIVKMDDVGLYLARSGRHAVRKAGLALVHVVPSFMRALTVIGTIAMFTVGGGILAHGLHFFHYVSDALAGLPLHGFWDVLSHALLGLGAGAAALGLVTAVRTATKRLRA